MAQDPAPPDAPPDAPPAAPASARPRSGTAGTGTRKRAPSVASDTEKPARRLDFAEVLALPGVEEEVVLRSKVGFLAFHGGNLERMTDEIASVAAARSGASLYAVRQPPGVRHHVPSNRVSPDASQQLAAFLDHVDVAIAIHGYGRDGLWKAMLLGGSNRELARHVGGALRTALPEFTVLDDLDGIPPDLAGQHPDNPVNRPRGGGVQIELPPRVRGLTPHAMTMPRSQGRIGWTNDLIGALSAAAKSWPQQ